MTETEARAIIMQRMERDADEEYPVPWVGDLIEETPEAFTFEATTHKENESPRDDYAHWFVYKDTGRTMPNIVLLQ